MGKQKASSASSATRKKHAKKAAGDDASGPSNINNAARGKGAGASGKAATGARGKGKKNAEPRVKMYIPPVKPQALQRDPVDVLHLASSLPPDLLVVFRKLTKKDAVTRQRALEELMGGWFEKLKDKGGEADEALVALEIALPAWCYHFPTLTLHTSRRIRFLAATIQAAFLNTSSLSGVLWSFLKGPTMDVSRLRGYYGAWMLSAHDVDRQVSQVAGTTWNTPLRSFGLLVGEGSQDEPVTNVAEPDVEFTQRLENFILHAIMHPQSLYTEFYPAYGSAQKPQDDLALSEQSEEERAGDRDGRIRIAALAALKAHIGSGHSSLTSSQTSIEDADSPHGINDLFGNAEFWSILFPGKVPPYIDEVASHHEQEQADAFESLGMNQPGIRRAGWALVHLLSANHLDRLQDVLPIMSAAILRSIWVEPDAGVRVWSRDGLLTFVSKVPESWDLASSYQHQQVGNESSDEEEGDEAKPGITSPNPAYEEFLHFLRLGCGGSATQFYPAIVVIVSKLPRSLFPESKGSIATLFEAMWTAVDGHALNVLERGSAPNMAFVSAHLETLVLLVGTLCSRYGAAAAVVELADELVRKQVGRMWECYATKKLAMRSGDFGTVLGKALLRLQGVAAGVFDSAWNVITGATEALYEGSSEESEIALRIDFMAVFRSLYTLLSPTSRKKNIVGLLCGLTGRSLDHILQSETVTSRLHVEHLGFMMRDMAEVVREDEALSKRLQELFSQHLEALSMRLSPTNFSTLVVAYLVVLKDAALHRQEHWHALLSLIGTTSTTESLQRHCEILKDLLVINETQHFEGLRGNGELSSVISSLLEQDSKDITIQLIHQHEQFLSADDLELCATFASSQVEGASNLVLRQEGYEVPQNVQDAIKMLSVMQEMAPQMIRRLSSTLSGPMFVLGCIYPLSSERPGSVTGLNLWDDENQDETLDSLLQAIRSWILDPDLCVSSEILVRGAMMIGGRDRSWILNNMIPSPEILERLFEEEISVSPDPVLAAGDLLVPEEELEDHRTYIFDKQQLSSYARLAWALTCLVSVDRQLARGNIWILKHSLLLQQMAEDRLQTSRGQNSSFGPGISRAFLLRIVESARLLTVYLFSDVSAPDLPHASMVEAVEGKLASRSGDIVGFIVELCGSSVKFDYPQLARITRSVLSHALRRVPVADADKWLSLSRKIKKTAHNTELAIISSIIAAEVETPLLTRMRNEAASDLTSIPAKNANTQGSSQLQLLLVLAPIPDSDAVFIPSQRALMVAQTIEKWISSDEDIEPVIESRTLSLFGHLAPILQSVMGRHWDFAFDLIENTLENSSLEDSDCLVQLSRALDLVSTISRFGSTNKQLNAAWSARGTVILRLVRELICTPEESQLSGSLQETCRSQAINILQEPPEGIIEASSLSRMVHLLRAPSLETQRGAYSLVRSAAQKYSEKIVLEVGLNPTAEVDARLPPELMNLLETIGLWDEQDSEGRENERASARFGTLLGWMTILDAFENTSFRVRSSYVEQLRNSGVIQNALIPGICDFLQLGKPGKKPLKLDLWEVDKFVIPLYEHESIRILAAHVYYRALTAIPSLIRTWWTDCKDRQLSSAFAASTAAYFSPVLVASELANLREPSGTGGREKLEDDALSIKISQAISEVSVIYLVDEQQMEMAVKLPAEYPLKLVEVRDVRRVGVAEEKWRGWLFAVQQIISTQNGHIADALALFKKNVTLHFEGQVECAICYSIISVTDLQLPTKPCKTCKNRFHASCLYKWFKSSSSSSCPLCRSDIF